MMTPPKATAALTKYIPHAEVVRIENCGHQLMAEQPDAVLDTLFAFASK
jgi:pimeloyl-ACP methyl ester carboxylesterase